MTGDLARLDPDIRRFLAIMKQDWQAFPDFDSLPLNEARSAVEQVRARWSKGGPDMAETIERDIRTAAGPIRIRIHRPHGIGLEAPALVYLHGGGFTLFSLDTHDRLMREYAARAGLIVIGLDYPLSPEAKFPVALDLITAFTLWLADNGREIGIDRERIALAGDSAGGNLSIATCLRLRDIGRLDIVTCVLSNYGGFSSHISDEFEAMYGGPDAIINRAEALTYWANYLNGPGDAKDPYACPLHADLHGLPPVFLIIAEIDVVAESSLLFGRELVRQGVEVTQKVFRGATHSFIEAMSISALAIEAIEDGARFLRTHLVGGSHDAKRLD
ncbi:MAG: alpha/beta hydrolase fold domain-containing protein [Asticcacaulis sp.]|uniref:alpha/beta hydrolase fold domain-containing protein n=1 Tax=Asticcacaulis sp. TaxID=1872648 RepID=UPI0039E6F108